jgi:hypothetical protein
MLVLDEHQRFENRLHAHARRVIPPGSFVVPIDAAFALGAGNGELGESIIAKMFAGGRYSEAMPRVLPPEVVKAIGHGDIGVGRRVLNKFIANLRAQHQHADRPQARYARGGAVGKMSKSDAGYEACGDENRICVLCSMWRDNHRCSLVAGHIDRTGTCKHFAKAAT